MSFLIGKTFRPGHVEWLSCDKSDFGCEITDDETIAQEALEEQEKVSKMTIQGFYK